MRQTHSFSLVITKATLFVAIYLESPNTKHVRETQYLPQVLGSFCWKQDKQRFNDSSELERARFVTDNFATTETILVLGSGFIDLYNLCLLPYLLFITVDRRIAR